MAKAIVGKQAKKSGADLHPAEDWKQLMIMIYSYIHCFFSILSFFPKFSTKFLPILYWKVKRIEEYKYGVKTKC